MLVVDPLQRHFLFIVCNTVKREQFEAADILAVDGIALEGDHLAGNAVHGLLDSFLAGTEGFVDIGLGSKVSAAALQEAQLDPANLGAGALLKQGSEQGSQTAQLGVAEAIGGGGFRLGDKAAVGIMDALGNSDQDFAALCITSA